DAQHEKRAHNTPPIAQGLRETCVPGVFWGTPGDAPTVAAVGMFLSYFQTCPSSQYVLYSTLRKYQPDSPLIVNRFPSILAATSPLHMEAFKSLAMPASVTLLRPNAAG